MRTAFKLSLVTLALAVLAVVPKSASADYVLTITDVEGANNYTASIDITNGTVLPAFPAFLSNGSPSGVAIASAPGSVSVSAQSLGGTAGTDASFNFSASMGNILFNVSTASESIGTYLGSVDLSVAVKTSNSSSAQTYFNNGGTANVTTTLTQDNISLPAGYPNVTLNLSGGGGTAQGGTQDLSLLYNGSTPAGLGPISATSLGALPNGITGITGMTYPFSLGVSDAMTFTMAGTESSGNWTAEAYVPEPGTLAILLSGLPLVGYRRLRRRKNAA